MHILDNKDIVNNHDIVDNPHILDNQDIIDKTDIVNNPDNLDNQDIIDKTDIYRQTKHFRQSRHLFILDSPDTTSISAQHLYKTYQVSQWFQISQTCER